MSLLPFVYVCRAPRGPRALQESVAPGNGLRFDALYAVASAAGVAPLA